MAEPTYIFKDGHVYTMVEGQVISSVKEAEFDPSQEVPGQEAPGAPGGIEMPEVPAELQGVPCPGCGMDTEAQDQFCPQCGTSLTEGGGPELDGPPLGEAPGGIEEGMGAEPPPVAGQAIAQVVTTPNGLKGRVLARVPSLWGEEVTVRFENGNIAKIPVDQRLTFAAAEETPEETTSVQSLEERLATHFHSDKMSLVARGRELKAIKREASAHVASVSDAEAVELSKIATQADYELREVEAALDAIVSGETEAFTAPAPIDQMPEVVQASTGSSKADWLTMANEEMVAEANATDYTKLMDEGPERFVASLSPAQIADAATTRVMATREIEAKTAGADDTQKEAYTRMWLARVETQRKAALSSYKEEVAEKTASADDHFTDESLFL